MKELSPTSKSVSQPPPTFKDTGQGFPKVVAGGRFVRPDAGKSHLERMVTGSSSIADPKVVSSKIFNRAILDSVFCNLEAGMEMLDQQENNLAKIGGRLSEIALSLNQAKVSNGNIHKLQDAQGKFETARDKIRLTALGTYDQVALFSNTEAKPVTIAVPSGKSWEGLSVDRANLGTPGMKSVDQGKVFGDSPGHHLDHSTIRRAFREWRSLCINNRLQWSMLMDRLHSLKQTICRNETIDHWTLPKFPDDPKVGPLRRPNRNN